MLEMLGFLLGGCQLGLYCLIFCIWMIGLIWLVRFCYGWFTGLSIWGIVMDFFIKCAKLFYSICWIYDSIVSFYLLVIVYSLAILRQSWTTPWSLWLSCRIFSIHTTSSITRLTTVVIGTGLAFNSIKVQTRRNFLTLS